MNMSSRSMRSKQAGAALLVSLMILLIISMIGVTAMKTSMFNNKIATSSQAANMAFMAAENAVDMTMREVLAGTEMRDSLMAAAASGGFNPIYRCMTGGVALKRDCAATELMDSRGLAQASSRSVMTGLGSSLTDMTMQISQTGSNSAVLASYTFMIGAVGSVPVLNVDQYIIQEFSSVGAFSGGG